MSSTVLGERLTAMVMDTLASSGMVNSMDMERKC